MTYLKIDGGDHPCSATALAKELAPLMAVEHSIGNGPLGDDPYTAFFTEDPFFCLDAEKEIVEAAPLLVGIDVGLGSIRGTKGGDSTLTEFCGDPSLCTFSSHIAASLPKEDLVAIGRDAVDRPDCGCRLVFFGDAGRDCCVGLFAVASSSAALPPSL